MRRIMALLLDCTGHPDAYWGVTQACPVSALQHRPGTRRCSRRTASLPPASLPGCTAWSSYAHYFGQTVILLLQHSANGTVGLIMNQSFNLQLSDAVKDIDKEEASKHTLFFGGPLGSHRVFMLMRRGDTAGQAHQISDDIYFSAHRDVLERALERKTSGSELRLFLGYSSWSAGQLAGELMRGSWHLATGDPEAIFNSASHGLWDRLIETLEPRGIEVKWEPGKHFFMAETGLQAVGLSIIGNDW